MTAITDLARAALELANDLGDRVHEATKADPNLTSEANARKADEARSTLTAEYAQKYDNLIAEGDATAERVSAAASRVRPHVDPQNAADLARSEQGWAHIVRPRLEQHTDLHGALAHADADATLGAERFAAAWLDAHSQTDGSLHTVAMATVGGSVTKKADSRALVASECLRRFAGLAATESERDALLEAAQIETDLTLLRETVALAKQGNPMGAAINMSYAGVQRPSDNATEEGERPSRSELAASIGANYVEV